MALVDTKSKAKHSSRMQHIGQIVQRTDPFTDAISRFGASLKPKFAGIAATGSPEDQLRGPLEQLVQDIVVALGWAANVVLIGESSVQELKTRPDFAVTKQNLLVGFI